VKVSPFKEVVANAKRKIDDGWTIYQQFNCAHCGAKQTMDNPNVFFTSGRCEECQGVTDIRSNGCNFMATRIAPTWPTPAKT